MWLGGGLGFRASVIRTVASFRNSTFDRDFLRFLTARGSTALLVPRVPLWIALVVVLSLYAFLRGPIYRVIPFLPPAVKTVIFLYLPW